jgi:hypothetical protein
VFKLRGSIILIGVRPVKGGIYILEIDFDPGSTRKSFLEFTLPPLT